MTATAVANLHALGLPRDDAGRVVGFAVGREASLRDWLHRREAASFERVIAVLRATKWNLEHKARRAEIMRRYNAKPEVKARVLAWAKARRAERRRADPVVCTCEECGATWCRMLWSKGTKPRYCGEACRQRARYQERTPGARRTARRAGR